MNTLKVLPVFWSLAAWMAFAPSPARAVTDVWNGAGTDWNTISDWNSAIPTSTTSDTAVFSGTGNAALNVLLSSSGSLKFITFTTGAGAYTIGGAGTLTLVGAGMISTDNFVTGAETINTPLALSAGYTLSSNSATAADTLNIGGGISLSAAATSSLILTGTNTGNNTVSGAITNGSGTLGLIKGGTGTWVLGGNNTYTGATSLLGGTVVLDYTTNTGSKLGTNSALTIGGVNLQLNGGSAAQTFASTNFNGGGQADIGRTSGTETLSLGTLTFGFTAASGTATSVNFQTGVATTTSTTLNTDDTHSTNLIGGGAFVTVGSQGAADWGAIDASGNIVAFSTVNTAGYIALGAAANANTAGQYLVTDSLTTTQSGVNTLKIATSATTGNQTLTLSNNLTLGVNGGILDSAQSSGLYTITGGSITFGSVGATIQQYGNGILEIDSQIFGGGGIYFQKAGPGTLLLTGNNAWKQTLVINQGTVSVGSDANLGGQIGAASVNSASTTSTTVTLDSLPANLVVGSTFLGSTVASISGTTVTLKGNANATVAGSTAEVYSTEGAITLDGGTLEATGTFSLSESTSGTTVTRAISLGANGGTIQVDGTNVLTAPGVVSNLSATTPGSLTKTGTGTLVLSGANTYTGPTLVSAGTLTLNGTLGATAVTVANGGIFGGTGTLATAGIPGSMTVNSGGTLVAGGGVAGTTLKVNGVLTLLSGSTLQFALGAGNTNSVLALSTAITGNSFASGLQIDFTNIQAGTYAGLITGLSSDPTTEASWVLAAADAGYSAVFTYSSGSINAVITALAVPEPGETALLAGGLALLAAVGVARRRSAAGSGAEGA